MSETIENPHGISITMSQFTDNVVTDTEEHTVSGDGIFDILMNTATKHLIAQYEGNRVRAEDYAVAYVQIYQATLAAAAQIWLQKPISVAQEESEIAKKHLYYRQIEGLDEDYKQKLLKIGLDSWAVGFSVSRDSFLAAGIPAPMQKATIDDLYNMYVYKDLDNYEYGRPFLPFK